MMKTVPIFKRFMKSFLLMALFLFLFNNLFAQNMASGVVTDASDGTPLPSANVYIQGTTVGTLTNLNGEFRLPLSEGKHTLAVSFVGYTMIKQEVTVVGGKPTIVNFKLAPESIMGEEVVVSAMQRGQRSAINSQLNASGIVNAVSEEQIQELPDANAGDAMGRLPGVSLKRSGGEAQNIVLRGLNEKFSMIQLDGVTIPSSGSDSRGVDLSMFSINSLSGIEVTKALTPDMDADAIAGTVNLVTKKASSIPKLTIDVGGAYNNLVKDASQYNVGLRYNKRLFKEFLGLQASLTAEKKNRSSDQYSQGWDIRPDSSYQINGLNLSFTDEKRKRVGGSLLFDINTSDNGTIRFNNFYNRTDRNAVYYSRDYAVGGTVNYQIRDTEHAIETINNSLSGENYLGKLKVNWGASHALTIGNKPYDHQMLFTEGGSTGTGMKDIPSSAMKGPGELLIPYAYNNFRMGYLDRAYSEWSKNKDRNLALNLDVERNFSLTKKINISIKAGAKYRNKNRSNVNDVLWAPYWVNQPKAYSLLDNGSIVPADYSNTSFANPAMVGGTNLSMVNYLNETPPSRGLFDGKYDLNPMLEPALTREWYAAHKNGVSKDGSLREYSPYQSGIMGNYKVIENVSAGYAMATLNLGEVVRIIGGVRVEKEKNHYTAKFAPELSGFLTFDPTTVKDTITTYTKSYVLPDFHIRIKPVDWFDLRLAATKSLARPDFSMRLPTLVVDRVGQVINRGNSSLNNTIAWNYDAIASFYQSKYGLFTVGGFFKKMSNNFYMLNNVRIISSEMALDYNLPQGYGKYTGFILNEPVNTNNTEVKGLEFDLQANLKFLPGFLGNFVLRGNFTMIESVTDVPRFKVERDNSIFPPIDKPVFYTSKESLDGQPSNFGNVALGYDKGGFSGRLSLFFQGDYVTSVSSNRMLDVMQKGYKKWDLALKQEIKKYNMEVMLNLTNITNMYEGTFYRYKGLDQSSTIYDMLIDLGVRITL
jgi:TonB-dependent receptor